MLSARKAAAPHTPLQADVLVTEATPLPLFDGERSHSDGLAESLQDDEEYLVEENAYR